MADLDHVFVCSDRGAPEAAALSGLSLTEGSPNTHTGQGTASRRFFFENALCLTFDFGRRDGAADLRPELPLLLRW